MQASEVTDCKDLKAPVGAKAGKPKKKIYSRFQFKDEVFSVGDICRFLQADQQHDLIGRIMGICSTDPGHPDFAKLKVKWLYQKRDLVDTELDEKQFAQIAEDVELFGTPYIDNVYVQSINSRVEVVSLPEFELKEPKPDLFFTRADYDSKKRLFRPEFNKWPRMCTCNLPQNPLQIYICCDACDRWFHPECEKTTPEVENFVCSLCQSS